MHSNEHGNPSVWRAVSDLAGSQRGVVSHAELRGLGIAPSTIQRWRETARLHSIHRGVYLVGHGAAPEGAHETAALLACGPGSAISHRTAARWWRFRTFLTWVGAVAVTTVGPRPRTKAGVELYTTIRFDPSDVRLRDGIRITAPARTLLDLSGVAPPHELETAISDARAAGLVNFTDLARILERHPGKPGITAFRQTLALVRRDDGSRPTRSEAERRFFALVIGARLPRPHMNARVGRFTVDAIWPKHKLIAEVDGFAFHSDRASFERDRARDAILLAQGYVVTRVTWRQITAEPTAVVARLAAALSVRAPGAP